MLEQLSLFGEHKSENDSGLVEKVSEFIIPYRTEYPTVSGGMLASWIKEFCEVNNLKVPKGLRKRRYDQLLGMYRGMRDHYDFSDDDVLSPEVKKKY